MLCLFSCSLQVAGGALRTEIIPKLRYILTWELLISERFQVQHTVMGSSDSLVTLNSGKVNTTSDNFVKNANFTFDFGMS